MASCSIFLKYSALIKPEILYISLNYLHEPRNKIESDSEKYHFFIDWYQTN